MFLKMVGTPVSRVRYNAEAPEVAQLKQVHSAKDEIIMLLTLLPHLCVCFAIIFMGNSRVRGGSVTFFQGEESYLAAQKRGGSGRPLQKVSLDPSGRKCHFAEPPQVANFEITSCTGAEAFSEEAAWSANPLKIETEDMNML